ncbi:MAG: DUF1320 domain-containing protein [Ignavibacteriales bacterium]|nr:DUF1320 domain-containing protein [Melioribacteraceae bacterium]MCF8306032.1 DUF1320 domain-containing protein [Ignavibacteriales bacterium]MCF8315754.1 DUF1320 domain-containing protein [Ignavibacteriales bacterium]MCF8437052.1 DUF1320 domain-containing protein [Ignavibacteriales bacterium]
MKYVTLEWVQENLPAWAEWFINAHAEADETVLENEITLAEYELEQYTGPLEVLPDVLKPHLLVIIRKRGYDMIAGHESIEFPPQVIADHERTLAFLRDISAGLSHAAGVDSPRVKIFSSDASMDELFGE